MNVRKYSNLTFKASFHKVSRVAIVVKLRVVPGISESKSLMALA
jgi:hypothetical protein